MQGIDISEHERHSRLMNEFDKLVAENGESLTSMYESQFEPNVKPSKAKKVARNHDPLALVSNSHANPPYSHASPSYSRSPQPYYVTHPSYVIDYDDDYQGEIHGDAQKDKELMLLAAKDEAGVNLEAEENDFMLITAYGDVQVDLNALVIIMARIQPTNDKSDAEPNYDAEVISEVNASQIDMINGLLSKSDHEHRNHEKLKTVIRTSADDQIDSDIISDNPYVDNNSGQAEHDPNAHDQPYVDIESLIYNVQVEAESQRKINNELKKQKALLQRELETVASSSSVRRPESKDNNLNKRVLLHTKSKSTFKDVKKSHSSVSLVSNKRDTFNSNVFESKTNVLNAKTVNAMNDGSNLVCVSYGKDVFIISDDKCVARYALSMNSTVKRALFTSPVAAESNKLGATPVVAKSRLSVATPKRNE
ncbi:hypothetical protein Tco_0453414 [Tanacetum coccineum]